MIKVRSKALKQSIEVHRVIGALEGRKPGPTTIFIAGLHGNEPSGVFALKKCFEALEEKQQELSGKIYALAGNMSALSASDRYISMDLNRMWTPDKMERLEKGNADLDCKETLEQLDLFELLSHFEKRSTGAIYLIDLHTTSSKTIPFIATNKTLRNIDFSKSFPCPCVSGIDEHIKGTLLDYYSKKDWTTLAFESGQHDALDSINLHMAFIWLSLSKTENIDHHSFPEIEGQSKFFSTADALANKAFQIRNHFELKANDAFKMQPGFSNFQSLSKGETLAVCNEEEIVAQGDGHIFMPLYQNKGNDGFFIIEALDEDVQAY